MEISHNQLYTHKVKTTIWEQIHLNFYTTYNYNKWHNTVQPCPMCRKIPDNVFHIILECNFVISMWKRIETTLYKIDPLKISPYELAFGIQPKSKSDINMTILRNFLTFTLRNIIMEEERKAYYKQGRINNQYFITMYNNIISEKIITMNNLFRNIGQSEYFENIITLNSAVARKMPDHSYKINQIIQ